MMTMTISLVVASSLLGTGHCGHVKVRSECWVCSGDSPARGLFPDPPLGQEGPESDRQVLRDRLLDLRALGRCRDRTEAAGRSWPAALADGFRGRAARSHDPCRARPSFGCFAVPVGTPA